MKKRVVDFAEIEHLEHEAESARERVRQAKRAALLASGWTEYVYTSPYWNEAEPRSWKSPRERYAPPGAKRVREIVDNDHPVGSPMWGFRKEVSERSKRKKFYRYVPDYQNVGIAFETLRRRARKACGPTSCEREPRKKSA